ncbi:unnamed protein product [Urochloa decumbens]|uniref:Protein kinase domain-containing protein n=1 Tax=Urochloa decumbens TaxID=240449 RepID=A0ABC9B265_9POAL
MVTFRPLLPLLLLLLLPTTLTAEDGADAAALLRLKQSISDPTDCLAAWSPSSPSPPCDAANPWPGVQCYKGVVVGLRLTHMNLSGGFNFTAISTLPGLHSVNLKHNNFSVPLSATGVAAARSLRALYLSFNAFSGAIPADVFTNMRWLKKLYLEGNNVTGPLPADAIAAAPRLIELHLDRNQIDGPVPFRLPSSLKLFNVSHNRLTGSIPPEIARRFDKSAFAGNPGLCGSPGSDAAVCVAAGPVPPPAMPPPSPEDFVAVQEETSVFVVIGIILLVILLVTGAMVLMLRQDERNAAAATPAAYDYYSTDAGGAAARSSSSKAGGGAEMVAVDVAASTSSHGGGGGRRMGEFVLLTDDIPPFGLPDLMKASAEVLGNGTLGSAYKAAMRSGATVAVKRMRDMNRAGRGEFERRLHLLGELRHPNVLPPVGYHFRKEEKLIVSQFMPRGSLLYILHGDQSPNRVVLDWTARARIAVGVARGLAFLHEKLGGAIATAAAAGRPASMDFDDAAPGAPSLAVEAGEPAHGNLKSGNILLDLDMEPRLVDYGFLPLVDASQAPQAMFAFRSPEGATRGAVSPRSDVYCLGVVLLELVTGRFPSQYLLSARGGTDVVHWAAGAVAEGAEKELVDPVIVAGGAGDWEAAVRLLRVGVRCAKPEPETRPSVAEAAWLVEEIAAGGGAS